MSQQDRASVGGFPVQVFTVREVATILKVSARTVERLIAQHELAAVHVGRRLRITAHQLQAYLRQAPAGALPEG